MLSATKKSIKKILLVEDEPHLAFNLELNLKAQGYEVHLAESGDKALEFYQSNKAFDLLLLDVMIPEPNGFAVAKSIRGVDKKIGIIMLTARASEADRVKGLELGVDDYICKPFNLNELLLKVKRAVLRSELFNDKIPVENQEQICRRGPYSLNTSTLELESPSGTQSLTALESDILLAFMENENAVLSREYLLENVWGMKGQFETRTVDNFVVRLRKYLEKIPGKPPVLESIRGRGYRFNTPGTKE